MEKMKKIVDDMKSLMLMLIVLILETLGEVQPVAGLGSEYLQSILKRNSGCW